MTPTECVLCRGREADAELLRVEVWEDAYWRLTTSICSEVAGFSYLEPKRHIPDITQLDGEEARTFGETLARITRMLREETGSDLVYIYVFGDSVSHLHLHLAPHRAHDAADPLNDQMIRGETTTQKLANGMELVVSKDYPVLPEDDLRALADRLRQRLASE